ncbi:MAG: DUF1292 domain-containing protein [Lachnospiraceae bacterium]|nr:DUF1292 domain-containing protein [Lachnospiraceae bacterium]MBP3507368.1 DUF1292 domain-containing protein [Lachnospiraceae bacterium]
MEEKETWKTVPFTTENGEIVEMYVLEETTLQGIHYILVTEDLNDDSEEALVMIMKEEKQQTEDEFAVYDVVENEEELQVVAKLFAELMEDVDFQL